MWQSGRVLAFVFLFTSLAGCAHLSNTGDRFAANRALQPPNYDSARYSSRLPISISSYGEKTIVVNPHLHAWGAYDANGNLIRGGIATAGSDWCPDLGRSCRTRSGSFRLNSLGSSNCKSSIYPLPKGGAPMPYCMFFNGGQALHGSLPGAVVDANASHGCVRLTIPDAEWLRYNFVNVGTKVIVMPY
ncbi:MAG TPA: L,D-transpeptidase [Gammaproteobacteria bacterium]|nr:L,D-transpeptidase [Gammaproteobacteria bacterium]